MIYLADAQNPLNKLQNWWDSQLLKINTSLKEHDPVKVVAITVVASYALLFLIDSLKLKWGDHSYRDKCGRLLRCFKPVEDMYQQFLQKEAASALTKASAIWTQYGEPIFTLPEKGWSLEQLLARISDYHKQLSEPLRHLHTSGAIYTNSLKGY